MIVTAIFVLFGWAMWMYHRPESRVTATLVTIVGFSALYFLHNFLVWLVVVTEWPLNTVMASISFSLLVLSSYGYMHHLDIFSARSFSDLWDSFKSPNRTFAWGIVIHDIIMLQRMAQWDIWRPIERKINGENFNLSEPEFIVINAGYSFWPGVTALLTLASLYYSIPPERRVGRNWISAAWYPDKLPCVRFFRR